MKNQKIPKRYFEGKRVEISRVLVEEMLGWKSTKAVTEEEWMRIVDRLMKVCS